MIQVTTVSDGTYEVTVESTTTTRHTVTLSPDDYERLSGGTCRPDELIEASFAFLLEREPNTMILSSFDLTVIGRYFPEYEREIGSRLPGA